MFFVNYHPVHTRGLNWVRVFPIWEDSHFEVVVQFDVVAAIPQGGNVKWRPPDKIGTGSAASTPNCTITHFDGVSSGRREIR